MAQALEIELSVNALTPNQPSLLRLIERAVDGDTVAFEQIMIESQQRVMTMTWRMLGNEADARDACQEVFLRVFKYLGRFRQDQDFFAWLYTISVNVCRDISKKRRHRNDRIATDDDVAYALPSREANAEELMVASQQRDLIAQAISTLSQKERATIVLRDIEGLSTEEVARILNSSQTTVRSQISTARKKIKAYCENYLRRKERAR
ncbi:MAG TPA: sigma-70 family RNA polymerase sigma factor [Pyrinomonadaceae bacterium]|nr:sigma-70 family RNA polymerase sigma factor [Pyrinomonadaceae bacterium]